MGTTQDRSVRLLRVSTTRTDGGTVFGSVPKPTWENFLPPDRLNRVSFGNYCLLVNLNGKWILVDSGPGDKPPTDLNVPVTRNRSSLLRDLRALGISPRDIDTVILTHLHSEHAGGITHTTSSGRVVPTFPSARHIIQLAAWEEANDPSERNSGYYCADDFLPLEKEVNLELITGLAEIVPSMWVEPMPGPTSGHQMVRVEIQGWTFAFLGALVPTAMHLSPGIAAASDWDPDQTVMSKKMIVQRAVEGQWALAPAGSDEWVSPESLSELAVKVRGIPTVAPGADITLPKPTLEPAVVS